MSKCLKVFLTIVSRLSFVNINPHSDCFYVTHESRGRFLSRSTFAPKIPMRFGKFLAHRRLGPEIRVRNKQTRTSARRATYLSSMLTMNPYDILLLFSPRQVHIYPWNYSNVTNMPNISARGAPYKEKYFFFTSL